ncbi:MAG: 50S ribosomal protein L28 [Bacteroidetes bacterium]|nr:50S ribosomal protein L28 [Bacteroidota bacterium]
MARTCEITGKGAIRGNKVSHSNHRTKRVFSPNLQTKKFFVPEENKEITLRVSAEGIRHINKNGVYASIKKAREKGYTTK